MSGGVGGIRTLEGIATQLPFQDSAIGQTRRRLQIACACTRTHKVSEPATLVQPDLVAGEFEVPRDVIIANLVRAGMQQP